MRAWTTSAIALVTLLTLNCSKSTPPHLAIEPPQIVADGYDTATLRIESHSSAEPHISILARPHTAALAQPTHTAGRWEALIRAGVLPAHIRLRVAFPDTPPAEAQLEIAPFYQDTAEDGTPDFLRLQDDRDQQAFRRSFTRLAEAQYFEAPSARPVEIKDCAALIRYAYRQALSTHDAVTKYQYPFTPLGADLFRVRPGAFAPADLANGSFAQFADAKTLWRSNTHLVSRLLSAAMPGDLLFFNQEAGADRFHSMIYLGESQIQNDGRRYILYHTGPEGADAGEIRRPTVDELMQFPRSEWRPLAANPRFLGVFRWNILRK